MICEVDRELFTDCLQSVVNTIPVRSTYPVLQNILLEVKGNHLIMAATDLDMYVRREIPIAPETKPQAGKAIIPGKKLLEVTKELSEPVVKLSQVNTNVKLSSGKSTYTFSGLDPAEYPEPQTMPTDFVVEFPLTLLEELFEATQFAASRDESRPAMTGVYWEIDPKETRMVATDGHRLAMIRKPGAFKARTRLIVPVKVFSLFAKGEENVKVNADSSKVGFEFANTTIISRLIQGPYPEYERVIPKTHPNLLKGKKDQLAAALRRAAVFANPVAKPVTFELKPESSQLTAETPELGQAQESLDAVYTGTEFKTAFNAAFLLEILRHVPGDDIVFELNTALTAGVVKPVAPEPDRLYLLMPIRMD
jgi:DNA polymerase-3 subunit beta